MSTGARPSSRSSAIPQNRNQGKRTSRMSKMSGTMARRSSEEEEKPVVAPVASVPAEIVRPTKVKVTETEVEPPFTDIPLSGEMMDLLYSAVTDYSYFQLAEEKLQFQDTPMFQSRFLK